MNKQYIFKAPNKINTHIRQIRPNCNNLDLKASEILAIYAPFITDTTVTFEYKIPSIKDFTHRVKTIANEYPYFVYEKNNKIVGYAYASKYNSREAYKFSVD